MTLSIIVAMDDEGCIARDGQLPWHAPEDLRHFRRRTWGHAIIMGRRTFESIQRPLPGRTNIVVSRNPAASAPGCTIVGDLTMAIELAYTLDRTPFVIGGAAIYASALPVAARLFVTRVRGTHGGDLRFPSYDERTFGLAETTASREDPRLRFQVYLRREPS